MLVLITGANGFIGKYVAKYYKSKGYQVIGIGHGDWVQAEYHVWGIDEWHKCDITLENLILYANNPEIIVHCAGSGSVEFSIHHPLADFQRTVSTTYAVLEYIKTASMKTKLIYPSSAAVYGLIQSLPIKENQGLHPISPYGIHKKMAEEACNLYAKQYGISVIIMRLFSVYGDELKKQLLWEACEKINKGASEFWGSGEEKRDWIHIHEVAELMYLAGEKADSQCECVNVGTGNSVTVKELLQILFNSYGKKSQSPRFNGKIKSGNPDCYEADIEKIQQWGWVNRTMLQDGVMQYVTWYKENAKY